MHTVTVTVANVVPGDWDLSNNSAQTTIQIADPIVKLTTHGSAYEETQTDNGTQTYSDPWESYNTTYSNSWKYSDFNINGYAFDQTFAFPAQQLKRRWVWTAAQPST